MEQPNSAIDDILAGVSIVAFIMYFIAIQIAYDRLDRRRFPNNPVDMQLYMFALFFVCPIKIIIRIVSVMFKMLFTSENPIDYYNRKMAEIKDEC